MWRDREDGRATGQSQGVGPEAYLNSTSQGPTPEDARKDGHIHGRSRRIVNIRANSGGQTGKTKLTDLQSRGPCRLAAKFTHEQTCLLTHGFHLR